MGRLFEILLVDSPIRLGRFGRTRLYWSAEEPIDFHSRNEINIAEFHRMLGRLGLVIHTRQTMQCGMGSGVNFDYRAPIQLAIIEAYREHGLDVDSRREEIQACRRSAKRIEESDLHPKSDEGDSEGLEL